MPITLDGTNGITTPMYNGSITANAVTPVIGMKNKIINGACVIDQRNAGASVTNTASTTYTVDRWASYGSVASKFTIQQNAGSVTPPVGFSNYLGITSSSAYSITATDIFEIYQGIEGYNIADLGWGTANAKTVTLSFWVRSSLTGTFGGALINNGGTRSYPFSYTISSANTWEQKSITIAGDTSGTWLTTNGVGITLIIGLGTGSTYSGTAGSWSGSTYYSATGATSVVGTNGATFYITGVQLEVGSTATSFDYRPYGTELVLCQRYYTRFGGTGSGDSGIGTAFRDSASQAQVILQPPTTLRATPSVTFNGTISSIGGGNQVTLTVPASIALFNNYVRFKATQTGYTSLQNYFVYLASGSTDFIELSSEL
jgi:hypothetical protein